MVTGPAIRLEIEPEAAKQERHGRKSNQNLKTRKSGAERVLNGVPQFTHQVDDTRKWVWRSLLLGRRINAGRSTKYDAIDEQEHTGTEQDVNPAWSFVHECCDGPHDEHRDACEYAEVHA